MRGLELAALYLLVGLGVSVAALLRARTAGWLDAGLLFLFWPLYAPFVALGRAGPAASARLPQAEGLERRMAALDGHIAALDRLLAQPDFQREAAERERAGHLEAGAPRAAARVEARIATIGRLERRRAELADGLAEARALMAQLRVQAELMRVPEGSLVDTAALVSELECRVEGLDAMLELPAPTQALGGSGVESTPGGTPAI